MDSRTYEVAQNSGTTSNATKMSTCLFTMSACDLTRIRRTITSKSEHFSLKVDKHLKSGRRSPPKPTNFLRLTQMLLQRQTSEGANVRFFAQAGDPAFLNLLCFVLNQFFLDIAFSFGE
jgi:hypothetical protein